MAVVEEQVPWSRLPPPSHCSLPRFSVPSCVYVRMLSRTWVTNRTLVVKHLRNDVSRFLSLCSTGRLEGYLIGYLHWI